MAATTDLIALDLMSDEAKRDPYPILRRLRTESPIHRVEAMGLWLVTRYDDVRDLFTDPRLDADRRTWEHYEPGPEGPDRNYLHVISNGLSYCVLSDVTENAA